MPHQQPSQQNYSQQQRYTLTDDLPSSSDDDEITNGQSRNENYSSAQITGTLIRRSK